MLALCCDAIPQGGESVTEFCVAARSTIIRRTFAPPTATTTSRTTVTTTTVSALGVPCLAGIRWLSCFDSSPAERARVQSPSPSRVGLLFVSPTNGRSAKCKTDPAGLVGRKARTPRRIICCRILPRLASPDASKHVALNATGVIKLMSNKTRIPARPASVGIRMIRALLWQILHLRCSLRTNRHELDEISFSLYSGDVDRPRNSTS